MRDSETQLDGPPSSSEGGEPEPVDGGSGELRALPTRDVERVAAPRATRLPAVPYTSSPPRPSVLETQGLAKRYGSVTALASLDVCVPEGEVYGFLGRNGAGKSTAIRIVMGITKASSGELRLFGEAVGRNVVKLRQRIGYVAQEQNFYGWMTPRSLGRFLRGFFPTWDQAYYDQLVQSLDLPPRRRIRTFSGGMKVKLALAGALAHRPRLLVLDEPTAGLDPVARREFLEMVREQADRSGHTTFFSTHLIDEIELAAHRLGIIDQGRMRYEGKIEDLVARVRSLTHSRLLGEPSTAELPPPLLTPEGGFRILQDRVREAERTVVVQAENPSRFQELLPYLGRDDFAGDGGWTLDEMPLEEIFIEMVRRPLALRGGSVPTS